MTHVHVLILNEKHEVLVVSRKNDHNAFGLPGGKVENIDSSNVNAAKREVFEETGIALIGKLKVLYERLDSGSHGITYITTNFDSTCQALYTDEPHIVKWGSFADLLNGPFAEWNAEVFRAYMKLHYPGKFDMPNSQIIKIAASGTYGAFGNDMLHTGKKPFNFVIDIETSGNKYNPLVAEAITTDGRKALDMLDKAIESSDSHDGIMSKHWNSKQDEESDGSMSSHFNNN